MVGYLKKNTYEDICAFNQYRVNRTESHQKKRWHKTEVCKTPGLRQWRTAVPERQEIYVVILWLSQLTVSREFQTFMWDWEVVLRYQVEPSTLLCIRRYWAHYVLETFSTLSVSSPQPLGIRMIIFSLQTRKLRSREVEIKKEKNAYQLTSWNE